ncbi:hypothetical protein [Paenibacillus luteus]|uniref:hypothetical protein n=1 Tax=Paenibacillus luteus TaxID=2545753 RepID=UPI001141D733|nr:hypothetical protein [Paenibacillus luteus]
MKKTIFLASLTIAATTLTGHAWADQKSTTMKQHAVIAPAKQQGTNPSVIVDSAANPYEIAGIDDPKAFIEFFNKLQKAVAANDKKAVANLIAYPLRVNHDGKSVEITSKKQFISKYNQIITDQVKKKLLAQDVDKVFVNWKGIMIGDGEIWISVFDNKIAVYAVNR